MEHIRNISIILLLGLFAVPSVFAIGVSANPPHLELNGELSAEITVANPSRDVAVFNVYPDEFKEIIKVSPASFVLEGGDEKRVKVTISPLERGKFETTLSIVSEPLLKSSFNASSGLKIPLVFTVEKSQKSLALIAESLPPGIRAMGIAVFFGLIILLFFLVRLATAELSDMKAANILREDV